MKTKRVRARRASQRHTHVTRREPCTESPAARDQTYVDASVIFNDSHASGRAAVWLDPPSSDERSFTTNTF